MAERKKYSEELKAIVLLTCSLHLNIHTEQSQVFDKQSNKI